MKKKLRNFLLVLFYRTLYSYVIYIFFKQYYDTSQKIIFVSAPFSGKTSHESFLRREEFKKGISFLDERGFVVFNQLRFHDSGILPFENISCPKTKFKHFYEPLLANQRYKLFVVFVGDWANSRGCSEEYRLVKKYQREYDLIASWDSLGDLNL